MGGGAIARIPKSVALLLLTCCQRSRRRASRGRPDVESGGAGVASRVLDSHYRGFGRGARRDGRHGIEFPGDSETENAVTELKAQSGGSSGLTHH